MVIDGVDYGPLGKLIGNWIGYKGLDKAPEPDGEDKNPYTDTLTVEASGRSTNAEEQKLVAVRYRHVVRKQSNGEIFHDQIGHWLYEPATGTVMHSLTIPRGVVLLAGGKAAEIENGFEFNVAAKAGDEDYGIVQSPFMLEKAKTKAFKMNMKVEGDTLSYEQTTSLFIYGRDFEHVDASVLRRDIYDD